MILGGDGTDTITPHITPDTTTLGIHITEDITTTTILHATTPIAPLRLAADTAPARTAGCVLQQIVVNVPLQNAQPAQTAEALLQNAQDTSQAKSARA